MAFQRSYSKVWWGSTSDNNSLANFYSGNGSGDFHSLDSHNKYSGNLSRIQEVEENSKLWVSHDSPGSLRSQVSFNFSLCGKVSFTYFVCLKGFGIFGS